MPIWAVRFKWLEVMAANVPGEHILVVRHVAHMIRIDAAPNATGVIDLGAERRVAKFYERGKAVAQVKRRHHNGVTIAIDRAEPQPASRVRLGNRPLQQVRFVAINPAHQTCPLLVTMRTKMPCASRHRILSAASGDIPATAL